MRRVSFETSLGVVTGVVQEGRPADATTHGGGREVGLLAQLDESSHRRLCELYWYDDVVLLPTGWAVVMLRDEYYGNPEYRATIEEVPDGQEGEG
jgi:hypothetical protein